MVRSDHIFNRSFFSCSERYKFFKEPLDKHHQTFLIMFVSEHEIGKTKKRCVHIVYISSAQNNGKSTRNSWSVWTCSVKFSGRKIKKDTHKNSIST